MFQKKFPDKSKSKPQSADRIQPPVIKHEENFLPEIKTSELNTAQLGAFVITIATQKGGVAKTTTAASLGGALVQCGRKVLLIDLDAQANLTLAMGKDPYKLYGTITDVLFNHELILWKSHKTSIPGLDIVPANSEMELAEHFLKMRNNYETILRDSINESIRRIPLKRTAIVKEKLKVSPSERNPSSLLETIPKFELNQLGESHPTIIYDVVILDCPPSMGAVTLNALVAADLLIIPIQPEFFSVHSLKTMLPIIREVRDKYNPNLAYRILITLYDQRNRIHRDLSNKLRQTCGPGVFQTIIEVDTKLRESALDGLPITELRNRSRSALQYSALAKELIRFAQQAF